MEEWLALLNSVKNTDFSILPQSDFKFNSVLLFENTSFDNNKNTFILDAIAGYSILAWRLDKPAFNSS